MALVARRYNTDIVLLRQGLGGPLSLRPSSYSPGLIIRKRVKGDAERKLGKSPVTANLAHKTVAAALGAAVKVGYILTNPALAVDYLSTHEARAQKETFTPEEIAKLLEAAPSGDWRGVILLGAFAGMRLGDALRLKWGNIDLEAGSISFTPAKTARLGKKLTLPIHSEVEAFLLKHPLSGQVTTLPCSPDWHVCPLQANPVRAWP